MGDTTNWEFAAAVAAVTIGLGGLLLFTIIGAIGSWRILGAANRSANSGGASPEATHAIASETESVSPRHSGLTEGASHLSELRQQAETLLEQQSRLQDSFRSLIEAGVLHSEAPSIGLQDLDAAIARFDDKLERVAAAIANLDRHT